MVESLGVTDCALRIPRNTLETLQRKRERSRYPLFDTGVLYDAVEYEVNQ